MARKVAPTVEEKIETHLDDATVDLNVYICLPTEQDPEGEVQQVDTAKELAEKLGCSMALAETIMMLAGDLTDKFRAINKDLKEIADKVL